MRSLSFWVVLVLLASSVAPAEAQEGAQSLEEITTQEDFSESDADVLRLYRAFFDRHPDVAGAEYWLDVTRTGARIDDVAFAFAQSEEFRNTYAATSNEEYVEAVYRNVLGRDSDPVGFAYWVGLLDRNELDRGLAVRWIAANQEFVRDHSYPFVELGGSSLFGVPIGVPIREDFDQVIARLSRFFGPITSDTGWDACGEDNERHLHTLSASFLFDDPVATRLIGWSYENDSADGVADRISLEGIRGTPFRYSMAELAELTDVELNSFPAIIDVDGLEVRTLGFVLDIGFDWRVVGYETPSSFPTYVSFGGAC